jgi:phage-related minor tail protein
MAYDIGPKIGIEGEAEFRKQIQNLTTQQKTLATEMQAVTSAFDKNDKSQEALTAQNQVLSKQIDVQKQKLDALKQGLTAAADKYGENDKVTQGWQQAVNKATAELNQMERQLKDNNTTMNKADTSTGEAEDAVKEFGKSMDNASDEASAFGDVLGGSLVADGIEKVADSAKDAAKSVLELAQSSDKSAGMLEAQLGLTKDAAADLSAVAETVWSDGFGENLDEATASVATIRQMLGDMAEDDMGRVTEKALTIKQVFGAEVTESVKAVKTMMQNFGITADQAFDLITVGYQNGLDYSGEFLDTLNEYSPQFKSMGISAQEAMNLLIQGSDQGAFSLDKVADAAKEFNIRIKDGSTTTQEGLKLLGINFDDLTKKIGSGQMTTGEAMQLVIDKLNQQDDTVKQNQAGVDLFGTQWEDLGASAVLAMGNTFSALDDVTGATERAGDAANDNLQSKFQTALRGIQDSLEPLAEQALDFANNTMPQVQDSLQWIADHASEIAAGIAAIAVGFAAWNVVSIISGVVAGIQGMIKAIQAATTAQEVFNAVFGANPIGIIITAIAALVAGIVVLWNTNEGFRNAVIGAWKAIQQTAETVWNAVIGFFTKTIPQAWNNFIAFVKQWGPTILAVVAPFLGIPLLIIQNWSQIKAFFSNLWISIQGTMAAAWVYIQAIAVNAWNSFVAFFTETIPAFIESVGEWFQQLPYNIGYALSAAAAAVVNFGTDVWNWVTTELPEIIQGIVKWFSDLPGNIWNFLVRVVTNIGKWGANMLQSATTWTMNTINAIGTWFSQLPGRIWTWLVNTVTNIVTWGTNMYNSAVTAATNTINSVVNWFSQLPGRIWTFFTSIVASVVTWGTNMFNTAQAAVTNVVNGIIQWFSDLPNQMLKIGENIVKGIWDGINGAISWLHDRITSFCDGIVDGFKKNLKIHSPSVLFADVIGKNIALGIGEGFTSHMASVASSMSEQVQRVAGNMAGIIGQMPSNMGVVSQFSGLQPAVAAAGNYGTTTNLNYTAIYNSPTAPMPSDVNRINRQNAQRISLIMRRKK